MLAGKTFLITGVLTDQSFAFHVAKIAQEQGAKVILSSFGRAKKLTERVAGRLPERPPVVDLDVTSEEDLAALPDRLREHTDHLDGVLHAIAFAPQEALGGNFLNTEWKDVATALETSAFSYKSLTMACAPLFPETGASVVGLTFDASIAWPIYDWMGVSKAALEATSRYLARDLGSKKIRVNLISAGPVGTIAAKGIPGFEQMEQAWETRAPLGWDSADPVPTAQACIALLSDWFPATTGEIIHVDGGFHAQAI